MNWLRYFLISTDTRNMAYKRPTERRFAIIFAISLLALLITTVLSLRGLI